MKWIHILGIVVLTALLSIGGTFLIVKKNYENEGSENIVSESEGVQSISKEAEKEEVVSTVDTTHGWEDVIYSRWIDEWKSEVKPLSESLMQEIIQEMAHQKIIAAVKESSIMITPERIDILKQVVEENKDKYEYEDEYLGILNRWGNGDFSTVDYDHNVIMYIQHSKYAEGLATGIASKEQEIKYIFRVFAKEVDEVFGSAEQQN